MMISMISMISMMFFLDFTLQYVGDVGDDHNPWESRSFFRDDIEGFFSSLLI